MESSSDQRLAPLLVEFAHTLGTDFSIQKILDHLVLRMVDILPVSGAGVMLMGGRQELHFVAASNDVVLRIERLQNELREGPCLEAYRTGEAVAVDDLRVDARFPRFSPRAWAEGLGAVFTFPMRLQANRLGALDLYRDTPGALSERDLQAAQVLADVAAAFLYNAQARIDTSAAVARLNHRSLHDPLTGLPNRTLFEELLDQAVARARRSHHTAAVLYADLDGFKSVNDRFGHHLGDQLLAAAATRMAHALRPGDTLARLGGDEFVVLCEDLHGAAQAEAVAERLIAAVSAPFDLGGRRIEVTASVGIAFSGPGQDIPNGLLRDADFAMYQAKRRGGGRHQVVDPAARLARDSRDALERDLQQAQCREQLTLVYQPIVDVRTADLVAVEALLRWHHPDRGTVLPEVVVASAERTGQILALGEWVLRRACEDLRVWRSQGLAVPAVSVNVSAHQVMGPAFAETVERVLGEAAVDPRTVCLEVTESVFLADAARAVAVLADVRDLGVRLSLDDFGTGYSSLGYLREFAFDAVKIDRSFIAELPTDKVTRSIVSAIIELGHVLDLTVTAEGVQSPRELAEVAGLGVDHAQGFHLGHPMAATQLAGYVSERRVSARRRPQEP